MASWKPIRAMFAASAAVFALAAGAPAAQAAWPDHAVKVIVSLPPGSGADTTARFISKYLAQELGQYGTVHREELVVVGDIAPSLEEEHCWCPW